MCTKLEHNSFIYSPGWRIGYSIVKHSRCAQREITVANKESSWFFSLALPLLFPIIQMVFSVLCAIWIDGQFVSTLVPDPKDAFDVFD